MVSRDDYFGDPFPVSGGWAEVRDDAGVNRMDGEGTHSSTPKIPEAIWQLYQRRYAVSSEVVHIRLRNGEIRHSLLVNDDGAIVGKVVGGQDGVDATAVDFSGQQIEAIRPAVGIVAALGLTRWVTAQS